MPCYYLIVEHFVGLVKYLFKETNLGSKFQSFVPVLGHAWLFSLYDSHAAVDAILPLRWKGQSAAAHLSHLVQCM